jgi:ribose 5-phosphate isomerase B
VTELAKAAVAREVDRGVGICGSGVGASVCANKIRGMRFGTFIEILSWRTAQKSQTLLNG